MGQIYSWFYPDNSNEPSRKVGSNKDPGQVNAHLKSHNLEMRCLNPNMCAIYTTNYTGKTRFEVRQPSYVPVRQPSYARIKLYHYTTDKGVGGIRREGVIRSSKPDTEPQHKRYGDGVYFTSYSPHDKKPDALALNCFTHNDRIVKSAGIYRRTRHVVEIEFAEHEVQEINVPNRKVYIHKGRIDLTQYEGRYKIYRNPIHPYDHQYSGYVDCFRN